MTHLPPFPSDTTQTTSPRVNLTDTAPMCGASDRKADTEGRAPVTLGRQPARLAVDAPATPRAGASTQQDGHRVAWHEISYRDPRKGERTLRWVKLPDAREQAKKVAARIGVEVTIWAVYRDASGRETHSAFVEVVR